MDYLQYIFKMVSVLFAISAVVTGVRAIVDPIGFSKIFGLPLSMSAIDSVKSLNNDEDAVILSASTTCSDYHRSVTMSYVSLMGVRQLAIGIILLTFGYQNKWNESATILAIIGIIVAGTDGIYLSRVGERGLGRLHAIPGALIAVLAGSVLFTNV